MISSSRLISLDPAAQVARLQAAVPEREAVLDGWHLAHTDAILRGADPAQAALAADLATLTRHHLPAVAPAPVPRRRRSFLRRTRSCRPSTPARGCVLCGSTVAVENRRVGGAWIEACKACADAGPVLCDDCQLPFPRALCPQQYSFAVPGWVHVCSGCRPRHVHELGVHDSFCGACKMWTTIVVSEHATACAGCGAIWRNDPAGVEADTTHRSPDSRTLPELVAVTATLDEAGRVRLDRAEALLPA